VFLSFPNDGMVGCVAMECCSSLSDSFGGNQLRVFEPSLPLVAWAIWYSWVLQSGPIRSWFVSSYQFLVPSGQAWELELSFFVDVFSLGGLSVSAHYHFSKVVECGVVFTRVQLGCPAPTQAGSAQPFAPPPPGRGEILPPFIWPPVLSRGYNLPTSCAGLYGSLQSRCVSHSPGRVAYSFGWN
jgi:hypothetical protein